MSPDNDHEDDDHRARVNLAAAVFILVIGAAIIWGARAVTSQRNTERCLEAGRKTCINLPDQR